MKREDDFEKQLIKDNLTIKEQIANLQSTISKLKNDMIASEQKNEIKHIPNNKQFKEDNDNNNELKFSFNQARKKIEDNSQMSKKKNFYMENLNKIRKEKKILNEMNNFKKENRISDIKYQIEQPQIKKLLEAPLTDIKINLDSVSDSEQIDKIISQSKGHHNKYNTFQQFDKQNNTLNIVDLNITTQNNSKLITKRSITPTKRKKRNVSYDNTSSTTSNEFKSYINEISMLKREIQKLEKENKQLYIDLQLEREQNKKYRAITEDMIKQFQKSKRISNKK